MIPSDREAAGKRHAVDLEARRGVVSRHEAREWRASERPSLTSTQPTGRHATRAGLPSGRRTTDCNEACG